MKRLEISRLMDDYEDHEFFPQGGSAAGADGVKARVLEKVWAVPGQKKMPRRRRLLLAGALAAALVVLAGAGLPYIRYQLTGSALSFEESGDTGRVTTLSSDDSLMEVKDGRVYSLLDGGREDITDQISEGTPYLVDRSDPDRGVVNYVIMGGTPEACGSFEWIVTPNPFSGDGRVQYGYSYDAWRMSDGGELFNFSTLGMDTVTWEEGEDVPAWLLSGMDELGIPYQFIPAKNVTTISG